MVLSIMRKKKSVPGVDCSKELKSDDLPATQGFVDAVRLELNANITTLRLEMNTRFNQIETKVEQMIALIAQMHANNEKQRNENRIVLDSMSVLIERQDSVERRVDTIEGLPS